ncbi:DKNYY domain-containing protein [Dysgonomonas macrotermitis]|uniref:DKNYY family protein n=1 Tax=Dysgonomonas macrotermitis TaxID=1346286 RepID=A0A1M5FID1_9BACT|nr:DKNYY domain-containing protein [Dysgonomonas macrotermitis]SHF91238.1 DKNYY family protein [Dysgonomonas macrotermitis]
MILARLTFSLLILLSFSLISCRKEKAVDGYKSTHYFYSVDRSKILYDVIPSTSLESLWRQQYIELPADAATFEVLSSEFAKDKKRIFYTYKIVMNVDRKSFYWDSINELPKDRRHVYLPKTETDHLVVIKYADPKTYERVDLPISCKKWYKDRYHYFFDHEKTNANVSTMKFDSPYLPHDNRYVFYEKDGKISALSYKGELTVANEKMVYDEEQIVYIANCDSAATIIPYKDIESLRFYDNEYNTFSVDSVVYVTGLQITDNNVDAVSFEIVSFPYCKDKNQVYYKNIPIYGSDPKTFAILDDRYAKDKKHVYTRGKILQGYSSEKFVSDKWGRYPPDFNYGKDPDKKD